MLIIIKLFEPKDKNTDSLIFIIFNVIFIKYINNRNNNNKKGVIIILKMDQINQNNDKSPKSSNQIQAVITTPLSRSKSKSISDNSKSFGQRPSRNLVRPSITNENDIIQNLKLNLQKNTDDSRINKSNNDLDNFVVNIEESSPSEQGDNIVNVKESTNLNNGAVKINSTPMNYVTTSLNSKGLAQRKAAKPLLLSSENNDSLMFFFVNRFSGEKKGQYLLDMGVKKIEFSNDLKVTAYIFDFFDDGNGIETLKLELSRRSLLKVIICAGDGSIYPFIERLQNHEVDITRVIFGILPFGRSNDLSRQFGYGDSIDISSDMTKFKAIVKQLNDNPSHLVDVWEIKLICDSREGGILSRNSNPAMPGIKSKQKDANEKPITCFRRGFLGYCSLGYDGRIGLGADKSRSSCKCWNSYLFFWEKIKKCLFRQSMKVNGFIESFNIINIPTEYGDSSLNDITIKENEGKKTVIFQTKGDNGMIPKQNTIQHNNTDITERDDSGDENDNTKSLRPFKIKTILLKGEPLGFVCQNIQYFFNGEKNSWSKNRGDYGLETYDPKLNVYDKEAVEVNITFIIIIYLNVDKKSKRSGIVCKYF